MLEGLAYRFDGVQLDSTKIANILKLVTANKFENLQPMVRDELMDTLARRPDNAPLAAALQQLAASSRFQNDRTTWSAAIDKVDRGIP